MKYRMQPVIDGHLATTRQNAALAKAQEMFFQPRSVRYRASFDNDPVKSATVGLFWAEKLKSTPAVHLPEVAALAAATSSIALAGAIEAELFRREGTPSDCTRPQHVEVAQHINSIVTISAEVLKTLSEIIFIADRARVAASGKASGYETIKDALRTPQI